MQLDERNTVIISIFSIFYSTYKTFSKNVDITQIQLLCLICTGNVKMVVNSGTVELRTLPFVLVAKLYFNWMANELWGCSCPQMLPRMVQ